MNETEKRYRFIPNTCIFQQRDEECPVEKGVEFTARIDGTDNYMVREVTYLGIVLAACPVCKSHHSVKEI